MLEENSSRVTVTSENRAEFMADKLGLSNEPEVLAAEVAELEPEAVETEESPENDTSDKAKPNKLEKRFSELTQKQRDAESKAQREADRAERAEKELQELRAKVTPQEPTKVADDELIEPNRNDYTDAFEYAKDLASFAAKNAIKQRDIQDQQAKANAERQLVVTNWQKQLDAARSEIPDFDDVLASTEAGVPDSIRDAIIESDVGAKILYHLAENPEIAKKLAEMSEARAMRELGKLEVQFESKETKAAPVATVSKAPQPITPVKGASVTDSYFDSKGEFNGSPAQYRELRKAGKIR